MLILANFALILLFGYKVTCTALETQLEVIHATIGEPLELNCTYNCSGGFVRGHWIKYQECPHCHLPVEKILNNGELCTLPLYFSHLSIKDIQYNYTCFTIDQENEFLPRRIERLVSVQEQAQPSVQTTMRTKDVLVTVLVNQEDSSNNGEFTVLKVFLTITVFLAMMLAALAVYFCISHNQYGKGKSAIIGKNPTTRQGSGVGRATTTIGTCTNKCERGVALRITPADCQSDQEVPYADIMITVRGSSTPELTQISYLAPGDNRERWREEAGYGARSHLQVSHSADRLQVHPREVSRKMSTSSEYAVITYS
ncbi:hypothetical protein UPYG_G00197930 [Umbra pygmaea]|uniref:Uncharacterized protein n=1 Tax=Umbra pygmaea TaxID=75934 RepID=A0ABD0X845_UMBPY